MMRIVHSAKSFLFPGGPSVKSRWLLVPFFAAIVTPVDAQDKKPELRWGTDPTGGAPYVYKNSADQFVGFEVELASYLAEKIGRTHVMKAGEWDKLPELLDKDVKSDEAIDIVLNGYELREDLTKTYAATIPYYAYRLVLLTQKDNDSITTWNDLKVTDPKKKTVGVLSGSVAHEYLKSKFGSTIELQITPDVANVLGLVKDKRLDATVQDNPAAVYFLNENPTLKAAGEPRQIGFYVIYMRKSDKALADALNEAIQTGLRDGTFKEIYQKYGLWNDDQEWLCYSQTGNWPLSEKRKVAGAETATQVNPWPRMLKELLQAAGMTVLLSVTSFPLAMLIGLMVALGRVYGPRWLSIPLGVYVEVLRGTPLLLQLYTIFYLVPKLGLGIDFSPLEAGIIGLAINYSAYEAENYRAGLLAIPRGQMEAALALGMAPVTALRVVIVPQALRIVIPPVTNDFIALFKDTSVCSVILITELTRKYNELYNFNRDYIVELAFVTAGLYLVMSYPMALLARLLERRIGSNAGGAAR
jgi:polar amino acid transport system substrate-binding protein